MSDSQQRPFLKEEALCITSYESLCGERSNLIEELINESSRCIFEFGNKERDPNKVSIELLLANNVSYLANSIYALKRGYLGIAMSLLRTVSEGIIFAVFMFEFPRDEQLLRKNYNAFYKKYEKLGFKGIRGIAQYADQKGTKLGQLKKEKIFESLVIDSFGKEANNFVHQNIGTLLGIMSQTDSTKERLALYLGPHFPNKESVKKASLKILHATYLNYGLLDKIFLEHLDHQDKNLSDKATTALKKWANE